MPKGWKYFVLSFVMTLFFCASLAMLVRIDQTCGGFDGAQTGTLLVFSPGENQMKVTLLSQEHTLSLTGTQQIRALWWKLYPLLPYPVKLGETLRECLFAQLEDPPTETEPVPEPEAPLPQEPQEEPQPEDPPATSWDTMPPPQENEPDPPEEQERETNYAPLFSSEELTQLEERREEAEKALEESEDSPEETEELPEETGDSWETEDDSLEDGESEE